MPQNIALILYTAFIAWLFFRDRKLRPMASGGLWIALAWILIIGSRPVSTWIGGGIVVERPEDYLEGSPLDRNIFFLLIVSGLVVLARRRLEWGRLLSANGWLVAFFLYCGISVLWSDFSFVAFKRWFKDIGNVVMVLVILTEADPVLAFRAVFARFVNIVIPLSMLFIKYIPALGRDYTHWAWEPFYRGVATSKNELGLILFVSGMTLVWDLLEMRRQDRGAARTVDLLGRVILLLMLVWLLVTTHSLTALVCLVLGLAILFVMRRPAGGKLAANLGIYGALIAGAVIITATVPGMLETIVTMLGRDASFTGRTDLWVDLLAEPIDPLFGTGYQSFWLGAGAEHMWEKYYFHPVQAHNGYLEVYLNGGAVGLFLLAAMILAGIAALRKDLQAKNSFGILRFSFFVVIVFYNWTEAMFSGMNIVWIMLLISALNCPCKSPVKAESPASSAFPGRQRAWKGRQPPAAGVHAGSAGSA